MPPRPAPLKVSKGVKKDKYIYFVLVKNKNKKKNTEMSAGLLFYNVRGGENKLKKKNKTKIHNY